MRQVRLVEVRIRLPEDLLSYCYQACSSCSLSPLNCLVETALMAYLGLGRCEKTSLLCRKDAPACELSKPKGGTQI